MSSIIHDAYGKKHGKMLFMRQSLSGKDRIHDAYDYDDDDDDDDGDDDDDMTT